MRLGNNNNNANRQANTVVVLDFETTGLSSEQGDRVIEIGAVLLENGCISDRFQQLINPNQIINSFIEGYTGITNSMLSAAPVSADAMPKLAKFIAGHNLVAHNASFDQRFLKAEFRRLGVPCNHLFSCSMLIARRLYQQAPNHTLSGLVDYKKIPTDGVFHRALADAEMTARLWLTMLDEMADRYQLSTIPFGVMQQLGTVKKQSVPHFFRQLGNQSTAI